jgi:hypothetical protein
MERSGTPFRCRACGPSCPIIYFEDARTVIKSFIVRIPNRCKIFGVWPAKGKPTRQAASEEALLHAMGTEAANVHLGSKPMVHRILQDLRRRKAGWLRSAAKEMAALTERDWKK